MSELLEGWSAVVVLAGYWLVYKRLRSSRIRGVGLEAAQRRLVGLRRFWAAKKAAWRDWDKHVRTIHRDKAEERIRWWVQDQQFTREALAHEGQDEVVAVLAASGRQRHGGRTKAAHRAARGTPRLRQACGPTRTKVVPVDNPARRHTLPPADLRRLREMQSYLFAATHSDRLVAISAGGGRHCRQ